MRMKQELMEDPKRRALYKTKDGVEVRPALRMLMRDGKTLQNMSYYYVYYSFNEDEKEWWLTTNELLFGEKKLIASAETKEEVQKLWRTVNDTFHLFIKNVEYEKE